MASKPATISISTNAPGSGAWFAGNNAAMFSLAGGQGSSSNGTAYGAYGRVNATTTSGVAYTSSLAGVFGRIPASLRSSANADAYQFGVYGTKDQDYSGLNYFDLRSGGVLGITYRSDNTTILSWGALGYKSSGNIDYGLYCGTGAAYTTTNGTGLISTGSNPITGIGLGSRAGLLGGWSRGDVMGQISSGEIFASYNMGEVYTTGHQIELVNIGDKKSPAFSVTSSELKLYEDGKSQLNNGTTFVPFPENFKLMLGTLAPNVTVTPTADCNGIFIQSIDKNGFTVKEMQSGNSNSTFTWIAVGKRKDAETFNIPEDLLDNKFDANMKGVMFDELDRKHSGTPVWWDGTKIRFDAIPKELNNMGVKSPKAEENQLESRKNNY